MPRVLAGYETTYALGITYLNVFYAAEFGNRVGTEFDSSWSLRGRIAAEYESRADLLARARVLSEFESDWSTRISSEFESSWSAYRRVAAELDAPWGHSNPVAAEFGVPQDLLAYTPVSSTYTAFFDLQSAQVLTLNGAPHVMKGGRRIAISGADMAFDEGGVSWTVNMDLAEAGDYVEFRRNDPFTLVLFGDEYQFIVDAKSLTRGGPSKVSMTISGVSPIALLDSGPDRAAEVTKTWESPILASAVVAEMAPGVPVHWDLLDWEIPAFRLGVSNASPLSVIQQVVAAAGGVAEANPDGSLQVRASFPVSVPAWGVAPADHVFTDAADNISVREGVIGVAIYDRFYLADVSATEGSDRLEFKPSEGDSHRGQLLAYPAVWRTNLAVTSTRTGVVLAPLGVVTREEEETVEFRSGTGQTQFPVDAILSTQWLDRDLGGVSAAPYSNTLTAAGGTAAEKYSLLRIRYRTKAIVYNAEYAGDGMAQFLLEDI